jgi:hypothetical protein
MFGDPTTKLLEQPEDETFVNKPSVEKKDKEDEVDQPARANVRRWVKRIKDAKEKWDTDFSRMRENMNFVAGLQWNGQKKITDSRYSANFTMSAINQRVAALYARDPKVAARRRPRLNYQLWDGHIETMQNAVQGAMSAQMLGGAVPPQMMALFNDYQQGRMHEQLVDKVGKTLEYIFQYQQDSQEPRYKLQMKQLVRRVSVCGVGYIKVQFVRDYELVETQSETRLSILDRVQSAKRLLSRIEEGKISMESADIQTLKELVASLSVPPLDAETTRLKERLLFEFPQSTSIIVDEDTRMLRGYIGGKWIAEEFNYTVEFVNAMYELDIQPGTDLKEFGADGKPVESVQQSAQTTDFSKNKMKLWQVYDLETKSTFIVCDGYKDYIVKPEPVAPATKGFWQIFPVTFNDVEVVEGCDATVYPPSDVDLIKHPQKEWNRTRNALRRHRAANRPIYVYPEGALTQEDLDKIQNADEQEFFGLQGLMPGTDPSKILIPLNKVDIKPELYDTSALREDVLLGTRQQEANMGPAQPNVTATVGTIAQQSKDLVSASDVDGLDDSMTDVAKCGGEMLLQEMSSEVAKAIAGPGGAWPESPQEKQNFLNELELEIVAASSGRPNKAIDVANWERIAPLIMQAVSMPPNAQPTIQAMIRETLKRVDDKLEPADFFPLPVPQLPVAPEDNGESSTSPESARSNSGTPGRGKGVRRTPPLQPVGSGVAAPLPGK